MKKVFYGILIVFALLVLAISANAQIAAPHVLAYDAASFTPTSVNNGNILNGGTAYGKRCSNNGAATIPCANGTMVDFFIYPSPTNYRGRMSTTTTADNFFIQGDYGGNPSAKLYIERIDSVNGTIFLPPAGDPPNGGQITNQYVRVRAWVAGDTGFELYPPYNTIDDYQGTTSHSYLIKFGQNASGGAQNTSLTFFMTLGHSIPSLYWNGDTTFQNDAALYHYNVVTGAYTTAYTCRQTFGSACPLKTNGQFNYIIAYVAGMENAICSNESQCATYTYNPWTAYFTNQVGSIVTYYFPKIQSVNEVYYPQEQVNIKLNANIPIGTVHKLGFFMDESIVPNFAIMHTTDPTGYDLQGGFIFSPGN